ncbi:MAG: hypothetical protein HFE59_09765 [Clostridiales bacterium]|nr:hypothetical protein [Clostridiales bacterium]
MVKPQREQTDKIILENQIIQMRNSMVEMERLYDDIRSVKHDMKNNMEVLQNLLQRKYLSGGKEDEEIKKYFEGIHHAVEQLDN